MGSTVLIHKKTYRPNVNTLAGYGNVNCNFPSRHPVWHWILQPLFGCHIGVKSIPVVSTSPGGRGGKGGVGGRGRTWISLRLTYLHIDGGYSLK